MKRLALCLLLLAACTSAADPAPRPEPTGSTGAPGAGAATDTPAASPAPGAAPTPAALVGTWTAGRGGTTVSYDAITGTSSSNASGLAFQFAADGTFAKAWRDSAGGSCGMIVVATESGTIAWRAGGFQLRSTHGETRSFSSCSPGAVAVTPMTEADRDRGSYTYTLDGDELVLANEAGASARFTRAR